MQESGAPNMIRLMVNGRWWSQRSLGFLMAGFLVIMATSLSLTHWHTDLAGQDCNICHVRYLPLIESLISARDTVRLTVRQTLVHEETIYISESFFLSTADRAPPVSF